MTMKTILAAVVGVAVFPVFVLAQDAPSTPADLELKVKRKTPVVSPKPNAGEAAKDAEAMKKKLEAGTRMDDAAKAARPSRPDLDPAISGGIQTKSLKREMTK
jgi:hypothetical protein